MTRKINVIGPVEGTSPEVCFWLENRNF
jgi:hypothetical protein